MNPDQLKVQLLDQLFYGLIDLKFQTLLILFAKKRWLLGLEVTIANRDDPDQTASCSLI